MTSYNRVLLLVGSAALVASLAIAFIFVHTDAAGMQLQRDDAAVRGLQATVDELVADVQEQRESLDEYLLSSDPIYLDRYRLAETEAAATVVQIRAEIGHLPGIEQALTAVEVQNDAWRREVAGPAIAAVQRGSAESIRAAIANVLEQETTQTATSQFVVTIDAVGREAGLGVRSDALDRLRVAATAFGVASLLIVAGLSLWFVRRYGLRVSREARRRVAASEERIQIIASLRTLRTQATPEATAKVIADALHGLPGVDVAAVFECTPDGLLALAVVGLADFPIKTGELILEPRARNIRERAPGGPWAERWVTQAAPTAYEASVTKLGIEGQAFAPILANGELIGLIGLATTDADHAGHLIEDLPAVDEFASVAEMILAPALLARRDRTAKRELLGATIASAAFRPVFQPVVDLATGSTVGFEALTRFDDGAPPDLMFATALDCGMGIELETVTLRAALGEARELPAGTWLSLNISPALLAQRGTLVDLLERRHAPIVLEVTEHEAIETYAPLREAMLAFGPDVRLAVDDVGAGVANFNHLVELRPHFVKIDVGLVRGVDTDPSRRAVVVGLVHFAAEAGCQVIAEGIETVAERASLAELGVTLGQGYLLGRPAPAATWRERTIANPTPVMRIVASPAAPGRASLLRVIPAAAL